MAPLFILKVFAHFRSLSSFQQVLEANLSSLFGTESMLVCPVIPPLT